MNATPTNIRPHYRVVLACQAQRAADIQVRIADAITGVWLLVSGILEIVCAFQLRSFGRTTGQMASASLSARQGGARLT